MSLLFPSSRSRIWISLIVGEEDEDEENEEEWLSCCQKVSLKLMKIQRTNLTSLEPR